MFQGIKSFQGCAAHRRGGALELRTSTLGSQSSKDSLKISKALFPKPETLNPEAETLNPKP